MELKDVDYTPFTRYGIACDWTVYYNIHLNVTFPDGKVVNNHIELDFTLPANPNDIDKYCNANNDTLVTCTYE